MEPTRLIVAGAGSRGAGYAGYALEHPNTAKVVGVAEPREFHRMKLAREHAIPNDAIFTDWKTMAARPKFADAVIIATQDRMHTEPSAAFAKQGYHILLEKPMAPTEAECRSIVDEAKKAGVIFGVCHVMRYTRYTRALKQMITDGTIGDIVSLQHLEPVGWWHQAHSFVRGNWRNESESSPMLLAKSCHDMDWIRHIMGHKCLRVSSFGSLKHFRQEEKPAGAADRCISCPNTVESRCPYSATRQYLGLIREKKLDWPVDILTTNLTESGVTEALRTGPYGRCVYACDNDVVDNQVVILEFEGGRTANFTMTAFTPFSDRITKVFGTHGALYGDGSKIQHHNFVSGETSVIDTAASQAGILGGHGGGDLGLMDSFIAAIQKNDPSQILSGPDDSLETHLIVFAAEQSRKESRITSVNI